MTKKQLSRMLDEEVAMNDMLMAMLQCVLEGQHRQVGNDEWMMCLCDRAVAALHRPTRSFLAADELSIDDMLNRVDEEIKPGLVRAIRKARAILELPSG